ISIIENISQQIPINITQQNVLGIRNTILGKNFLLGKTICSHQNKILLDIKDLQYHEALAYFPNQMQFNRLKESIAFLTNNEFAVDLRLNIQYSSQMNFILGNLANAKLGFGLLLGGGQKNFSNSQYCKYISLHQ
ncbi:type VI secretion system baseplate subunit TssG, partial [Helicobacter bilis]